MKVTAEPIEKSQVVLNIEVEPERLDKADQQAAGRLANQIAIPGFRKGKAPRHIVERMIGREAIREEALDKLIPVVYSEAVQEAGIDPIEQPDLEILSHEPFTLKATVPVRPSVTLGDYAALRIEPEQVEITDEEVEEVVGQFREQHAQYVPVERPARAGDRVTMDVKGMAGETRLIEREGFDYDVDLESQFPAPGFGAQIEGVTAGEEKTFTLEYPADYRVESLQGKTGEFTVTVSAVREKQLPDFDDELAKTSNFGETLEEMRAEIRRRLTEREEKRAAEEYERKVIEAVVEQSTIDLPTKLVERAMDNVVSRMEDRLRQQQVPFDAYLQMMQKTPEEFREEQRSTAEQSLRTEFVLNEIAQKENITVTPDELGQLVEGMAQMIGGGDRKATDQARRELSQARTRTGLAHDIMENKVKARLVAIARGEGDAPAEADAAGAAESGDAGAASEATAG